MHVGSIEGKLWPHLLGCTEPHCSHCLNMICMHDWIINKLYNSIINVLMVEVWKLHSFWCDTRNRIPNKNRIPRNGMAGWPSFYALCECTDVMDKNLLPWTCWCKWGPLSLCGCFCRSFRELTSNVVRHDCVSNECDFQEWANDYSIST